MGRSPAEVPERYAERSPSTYLDAVRTPLLMIAGEHDSACPIRQVRFYAENGSAEEAAPFSCTSMTPGTTRTTSRRRSLQAELELEFLAAHGVVASPQD